MIMKLKWYFLFGLFTSIGIAKADNQFLPLEQVNILKAEFRPILDVPPKFLKLRSVWYEGGNRQLMTNILAKEKIRKQDLHRLISLLNAEEKRLGYKVSVIADAVNNAAKNKFVKELSHLMPLERIEQEAKLVYLDPQELVLKEKARHQRLIKRINGVLGHGSIALPKSLPQVSR